MLRVVRPGALTTVQDEGRFGYQSMGIGVGGCMDTRAYHRANYLVGNTNGEAVLEMTFAGACFVAMQDMILALTGADMQPKRNKKPIPMNQPFELHEGDELMLSFAKTGCRCYLAAAGGFDMPIVLGSRSTNMKCHMGGFLGRALIPGDILAIGEEHQTWEQLKDRRVPEEEYPTEVVLRAVLGPQDDAFTAKGIETFFHESYTVADNSDRMGYRMSGAEIESHHGSDIISDGITLGSVQVASDGKPIVLMADRQTTGGYAKIATVCTFDIPKLAQCRPGDHVRFQQVSLREASKLARKEKQHELF